MIDFKSIREAINKLESRRIGKTSAAAELAKRTNGILITFNAQSARSISKEYGVDAYPIQMITPQTVRGERRPIIFDQDAFSVVLDEAVKLQKDFNHLLEQNKKLNEEIDMFISAAYLGFNNIQNKEK